MRRFSLFHWWLLGWLAPGTSLSLWAAKIVLIAGPITGHPKEAHEYEKCVVLLKELIETSPNLPAHPHVELHFNGWPADPKTLDNADTIVMVGDGGDHREQDHPLYVGDHREQFARQMARGCGCVFLHWSTFHPARFDRDTTEWAGGYFDYETGTNANHWFSAIQTWNAIAHPQAGHPVSRGLHPYQAQEEFYYRIKFREPDPALTPILTTKPPGESNEFTVAWTVERPNGSRGFGTTGGHYFTNYWQPDFRKMVLNAIAWTAHLDVPEGGVDSLPLKRFRTLIVTGANHPAHDWRSVTAALIPVLEQDPRVIVTVTENPEELAQPGFLAPYDLVVWNYVNWQRSGLSATAKDELIRFLQRGRGLSLIHFAASAFHPSIAGTQPADAWPEWYENIAARVWEHRPPTPSGHDTFGHFEVHPTSVQHPITHGLTSFATEDELYFHQAGTLPVEPLVTAHSKITGNDEPLAWAYPYASGRVFETVLGHSDVSIRDAAALIRRGSLWAARQSQLGFEPPSQGLTNYLWRDGSQWTPQKSIAKAAAQPAKPPTPVAVPSPVPAPVPASSPKSAVPSVPPGSPGTPKISGRDASAQGEGDWVDNRWQQTDVGPFLASNLQLPSRTLAKGLTIQVGSNHEGAVAYDLGDCSWQAAWLGQFLSFDPGRFGLIGAPKPGGSLLPIAPAKPTWPGAKVEYVGLHRAESRVILESRVDGIHVFESPGLKTSDLGSVFFRQFRLEAHSRPIQLRVAGPLMGKANPDGFPSNQSLITGERRVDWAIANTPDEARFVCVTQFASADDRAHQRDLNRWPHLVSDESGWSIDLPDHRDAESITVQVWSGPSTSWAGALAACQNFVPPDDSFPSEPHPEIAPASAHWPELTTQGQLGATNDLLAVDTLTLPYDNPFQALLFASGVDFGRPGEAFICTMHGDVWRVTGVDATLKDLKWRRYATGLFQPLGLRVRDGKVLVLGRDRITRLYDLNDDGEADYYENFTDSIETSTGGHDYVTCLEADAAGNLYYTDPKGVHRVSPDGRTNTLLATGWRNPNGLGVRTDGLLTVAPQQGEWTPSSQISEVRNGGYYGYPGPKVTETRPLGYDLPLCWIPHSVDNSSGSQVWLPDGVWGPLGGHLLHLKWGRCGLMAVLRDTVGDVAQGAAFNLPAQFLSGPNRATFNPNDGALYVAGSTGWQTSAVRDGSLQRVRWLGHKTLIPSVWHARTNGLELTFNQPLQRDTAQDPGSYGLRQWNYRYAASYGSKDWSVAKPDQEGHDDVAIKSARLSADGRTVFLETDLLAPVMQMELKWNLDGTNGTSSHQQMWLTLNRLDTASSLAQ